MEHQRDGAEPNDDLTMMCLYIKNRILHKFEAALDVPPYDAMYAPQFADMQIPELVTVFNHQVGNLLSQNHLLV